MTRSRSYLGYSLILVHMILIKNVSFVSSTSENEFLFVIVEDNNDITIIVLISSWASNPIMVHYDLDQWWLLLTLHTLTVMSTDTEISIITCALLTPL